MLPVLKSVAFGINLWVVAVGTTGCGDTETPPALSPASQATLAELQLAGEATIKALCDQPAAWKATHIMDGGPQFEVLVYSTCEEAVYKFAALQKGERIQLGRIVSREGVWYVNDPRGKRKTRPYEAVLEIPMGYLLLELSEPQILTAEGVSDADLVIGEERDGRVEITINDIQRKRNLEAIDKSLNGESVKPGDPEEYKALTSRLRQLRRFADEESRLWVNRTNGVIVERKTKVITTQISNFELLDAPHPEYLATSGEFSDLSQPPLNSTAGNWLALTHDPLWTRTGNPMADGAFMDMETKELRRLPYKGLSTMPSCFLPVPGHLLAIGFSWSGAHEVIRMDIPAGTYSVYQHPLLERGPALMGALSPDGKTAAAIQAQPSKGIASMQIILLDVDTGEVRTLGKPGRLGAPLNWLPDGSGLVLKRFVPVDDPTAIEPRVLCRLALDGTLQDIKPGDWPIVLKESKRILYESEDTDQWRICDLDGNNDELYADGLAGFGQPALSPDERHIVFRKSGDNPGPQLFRFELGKATGEPLDDGSGFFGQPVLR